LLPVAALTCIVVAAGPVAPVQAALLPAVGSASEVARRELDNSLRKLFVDEQLVLESGLELLSPVETRDQVTSLAEMGLVCASHEVDCLVKFGIVADVSVVLVPVLDEPAMGSFQGEIVVVDVKKKIEVRAVPVLFDKNAPLDSGLSRRVLGLSPRPSSHPPAPVVEVVNAEPFPWGPVLLGTGGALMVLSGAGAVACDLTYVATGVPAETRAAVQPIGAVLWGVTAASFVVAGAAGVLMLTDGP